ncbi:gamma-glutamyltransferase family protein [Maridesulfovibrio bastinii]|uniref:gamma-glutamyltransferase family protein n=1 Tax=Maridesulfovibrio bastinii TaxID=47157 RepID=UPI00040EEF60|nr:gamma-glutamyltransferase family protein [Maridesulfovibrio bastinii]
MTSFDISSHNSPQFEMKSRRSPVYATSGMVASSQPLATEAGLEMLRKGGTAADAAVAAAAALAVLEPCSTGLGGDSFALYYSAADKKIYALNGSGKSPENISIELLNSKGISGEIPPHSGLAVTTPGACAAWCDLALKFGSLNAGEIFEPAIRYAENGFPVGPVTAWLWKQGAADALSVHPGGNALLLNGHAPRTGEIFKNKNLAEMFKKLASGSFSEAKDEFYKGETSEKIVQAVLNAGGVLSAKDMAGHESLWCDPIGTIYRDRKVFECPPNGQGLAALLALGILQNFSPEELGAPFSARRLHIMIEAMRLGFADARRHITDPETYHIPLKTMLSAEYSRSRAELIDFYQANPCFKSGVPESSSDTVYFCTVDKFGNACSMVSSVYMEFGTGIVPDGLGFSLQNRGNNFSLDPEHPNALAPGKRTYHTIIPGMMLREDNSLYGPFGVMGGFMQPQGHLQVVSAMCDDGADPQKALDRLRFCISSGKAGGSVSLEHGIDPGVINRLKDVGHEIHVSRGYGRTLFGRGQIIVRDPESGVLCGGCDPRSDGSVSGII